MKKIRPFLWFESKAEEAAAFYVSIFPGSSLDEVSRSGGEGPGKAGRVTSVTFTLSGQEFMALNGGPMFSFNPAISFYIDCADQAEVDRLWEKLSEGGEEGRCGWLKDRYGISWQVIPTILGDLLNGPDPAASARAMEAMLAMGKLDIAGLKRAYEHA
jgi:predicted 3-demethylubiquinone-9 3-methyltransferase (glyoxalase superfamily)